MNIITDDKIITYYKNDFENIDSDYFYTSSDYYEFVVNKEQLITALVYCIRADYFEFFYNYEVKNNYSVALQVGLEQFIDNNGLLDTLFKNYYSELKDYFKDEVRGQLE